MMEWYHGGGFDDLVVPKDQELSDSLVSVDSWSRWGITAPTQSKNMMVDGYFSPTEAFKGLFCESDSGTPPGVKDQSKDSGVFGELSDGSLSDFNGIEHMDETFLNSILDDSPGNRGLPGPFCYSTAGFENVMNSSDDVFSYASLESQSISSNNQVMDRSFHHKTGGISPYVDFENEASLSPFIPCKSEQVESEFLKGPSQNALDFSEEDSSNINMTEESSLEESVLHDFQRVMAKLNDKTRMCFRDTFYRLAKTSEEKLVSNSSKAKSVMETPCTGTNQDEKIRSKRDKAVESYTNTIDRAIANLTFNNMDSNARDFPLVSSSSSCNQSGTRPIQPCHYASYQQHANYFPQHTGLASVAEVPVFESE